MRGWHNTAAFFVLPLVTACAAELPPAQKPSPEMPTVPMPTEVAVGRGIVVVDTPDGPSTVSKITGHGTGTDSEGNTVTVDTERDLCPLTPCATDLRKGPQTVVVRSQDGQDYGAIDITVGDDPVVVRHMYDQTHRSWGGWLGGIIMVGLGGSLVLSGAITYVAGHGVDQSVPSADHTTETIGAVIALTGAAFIIGGGLISVLSRGTHRAGATTIFTAPR